MKFKKTLISLVLFLSLGSLFGCNQNQPVNPQPDIPDTEPVDADKEKANEVIALIDGLNDDSSLEDINIVLDKYNDLTKRQKTFVTNYDKLLAQLERVDKLQLVEDVNNLMRNIDSSNPNMLDLLNARKAYFNLGQLYGEEWQNKVNSSVLSSFREIEKNALFDKYIYPVLGTNYTNKIVASEAILKLRSARRFFDYMSNDELSVISDYGKFLSEECEANKVGSVLVDDGYKWCVNASTFVDLIPTENDRFGITHNLTFTEARGNFELNFARSVVGEDWTIYSSVGFFISYDKANTEDVILIPNGDWDKMIRPEKTLIDSDSHLYFYEISMASILSAFTSKTYFQVYFSTNTIRNFSCSDLLGYTKDLTRVNSLINTALSMDTSLNIHLTRFTLLCNTIDSLVTEADKARLSRYSEYLGKKDSVAGRAVILPGLGYTTSHGTDNWPDLTNEVNDTFGEMFAYDYKENMTTMVNVFATARNEDWSGHLKFAAFIALSEDTDGDFSLVINNDWDRAKTVTPILFDSINHIYYFEADISTLASEMTGNPFIGVSLSNKTTYIKTTHFVGVN